VQDHARVLARRTAERPDVTRLDVVGVDLLAALHRVRRGRLKGEQEHQPEEHDGDGQ